MVSQKEAVDGYIQSQSDIESIKQSIQNLEKIIEIKLEEAKQNIAENKEFLHKHKEFCEIHMAEQDKRIVVLEMFSNKVIYLHTAVIFLVGLIAGIWGRGLFS